ncbi:MAG: chemotaxis protein CheD [Bacillota bacterium]
MQTEKKIHIGIGEFYSSKEPVILHTTLGSCVSVCFFDPQMKIGGMNHILLAGSADFKSFDDNARYGINAMELLINSMLKLGARRNSLEAKIFGGAHLMPDFSLEDSPGRKNIEFVKKFLSIEGIPVLSQHTGGISARNIFFNTGTSEVLLKCVKSRFYKTLREEEDFLNKHKIEIIRPDTTLF